MKEQLRSIAAAGNAAALVLLILVLACHDLLFGQPSPSPIPPADTEEIGSPVLLVVIDGLREDRSRDPRVMPNLVLLAEEAGRGTARVETLLPSTIAGIRTLAEGVVVPPGSFFGDFGTSRSPQGGIFAAASRAGIRTFAAGPRLWTDLYGPWLTGSLSVESVTARDEQVLDAGLRALRSRRYGLVVVHFNGPDDAAHLEGGRSKAYDTALAWCDAALGRLVEAAASGTTILVTGDHGVTDSGGHAGHEEEVVAVPVIGHAGQMRQRDIHRLVLSPFGIGPLAAEPPRPLTGMFSVFTVILALLLMAVVGGVILNGEESRHAAGILNAALWLAMAAALIGPPWLALLLAFGALAVVAVPAKGAALGLSSAALIAGAVGGTLRLLDGAAPVFPEWALPIALVVGVAAGTFSGRLLGTRAVLAGVLAALLPALVARLAGETVSLSTLDVRAAFRIVDGPLGLAGAAGIAALRQAAPALALMLGLVPALAKAGTREVSAFSAGLAAALAGQAAVAALVLLSGTEDLALASRSVSLLARLVGELSALFLGCAVGVVALRGIPHWRR